MFDTAFSALVVTACNFFTGVMVARLLGPVGRGQFGEISFLGTFFVKILSLSLFEALVVRLRKRGDEPYAALPLALSIALGVFMLSLVVVPLARALGYMQVEKISGQVTIMLVLAICLIEFLNSGFRAVESSTLTFSRMNLERMLTPLCFALLLASAYFAGPIDTVLVAVLFISARLPITLIRFFCFRRNISGPVDRQLAGETMRLAPRLFSASGTQMLAGQADRLIILSLWPATWIGFYFIAFSVCGVGYTLAQQALAITLLPSLAGLTREEGRAKIELLLRLSLLLALLVTTGILLTAPMLVPLVYGARFIPAVHFVQGMAVALAFTPLLTIVNLANRANERGGPGLTMALASLTIFIGGYLLTGYARPYQLFTALTLANLASFLIGLGALVRDGLAHPRGMVPRVSDIRLFLTAAWRYARQFLRKPLAMFGDSE